MSTILKVANLLHRYSYAVLEFSLGQSEDSGQTFKPLSETTIKGIADKIIRLAQKSRRPNIVLFGTGDGRLPMMLSKMVKELDLPDSSLHKHPIVTLCELNPTRVRDAIKHGYFPPLLADTFPDELRILTDHSPRAMLAILGGIGINIENSVFYLHPELPQPETTALRAAMQLVQHSRAAVKTGPGLQSTKESGLSGQVAMPSIMEKIDIPAAGNLLSVLAILHPEESGLQEFIQQIPPVIKELVIVWDSHKPVQKEFTSTLKIIQKHRPLDGDFSAQRNFALSLCTAPWVLALDGDEQLAPETWQQIMQVTAEDKLAACFLPRITFFSDTKHFRAGYGLWPDPQLRLFKRTDKTKFINPVHEVLTGVSGTTAFLLHCPILHYSYILKDRQMLAQRLDVFNQAAGKNLHRLSEEYPCLSIAWHDDFQAISQPVQYLLLPYKE